MSSGWTPLFATVLDGTLFGKWPHTGVWTCLLSQVDRLGRIDQNPALLAAKIGIPVETLMACIHDFMQPDPESRTGDLEGRRLELLDPASRDWGWRVINAGVYREKARKAAYDAARTESGKDAERKRKDRRPARSREVPRSPDASRSHTHTETEEGQLTLTPPPDKPEPRRWTKVPESFQVTEPMRVWAKSTCPDVDVEWATTKFRNYEFAKPKSDANRAWQNWMMGEQERHAGKKPQQSEADRRWEMQRRNAT